MEQKRKFPGSIEVETMGRVETILGSHDCRDWEACGGLGLLEDWDSYLVGDMGLLHSKHGKELHPGRRPAAKFQNWYSTVCCYDRKSG